MCPFQWRTSFYACVQNGEYHPNCQSNVANDDKSMDFGTLFSNNITRTGHILRLSHSAVQTGLLFYSLSNIIMNFKHVYNIYNICMCVHVNIYIRLSLAVSVRLCLSLSVSVCLCLCLSVCLSVCMHACMHDIYIYIYTRIHEYIDKHMYIYIYIT